MNTGNAIGFVGLGALMWILPLVLPGWFPPLAIDGTSTRALWLESMGVVQLAIGLSYLTRHCVVPAVLHWLAAAPAEWSDAPVPDNAARVSRRTHRPWYAMGMARSGARARLASSRHSRRTRDLEKLAHFVARLRELPHAARSEAAPTLHELFRQNMGAGVADGSREAA
jgi:hypothetical protein